MDGRLMTYGFEGKYSCLSGHSHEDCAAFFRPECRKRRRFRGKGLAGYACAASATTGGAYGAGLFLLGVFVDDVAFIIDDPHVELVFGQGAGDETFLRAAEEGTVSGFVVDGAG